MADSFNESFTGSAGSLVGRTPDGAGSTYAADMYNGSNDLSTMLVDGSGNLESQDSSLNSFAKSTFIRLTAYYTIEAKFKIGSDSTSSYLYVVGMDTTHPADLIRCVLAYFSGDGSLTAEVDVGNSDQSSATSISGVSCPVNVGVEQTLQIIVTPSNVGLYVDSTFLADTTGIVPDVSPNAVSFCLNETKPASPGTIAASIRLYNNDGPPPPAAVSLSFNTFRPAIFAPG